MDGHVPIEWAAIGTALSAYPARPGGSLEYRLLAAVVCLLGVAATLEVVAGP